MASKGGSKADFEAVSADIVKLLHKPEYDDGSAGPVLVRLAWHSAGTYDAATDTGGSNGAGMRYEAEGLRPPALDLQPHGLQRPGDCGAERGAQPGPLPREPQRLRGQVGECADALQQHVLQAAAERRLAAEDAAERHPAVCVRGRGHRGRADDAADRHCAHAGCQLQAVG
ncbi:hypothetical protein FH972_021850 [Carpinus fangiana]|uniref:Uncharacterized protein n=1 Tax=Carpinus fangiana TaxID=176857 RepID=A0A5N6KQW1_9ROSI|nr:hypothetical protein FH972_021850 [Carpinus fangiana]